jgi:hypothetical protein
MMKREEWRVIFEIAAKQSEEASTHMNLWPMRCMQF